MPTTSSADTSIVAAQNLVHTLQHPKPATPFATVQSDQAATLANLSEIFLCRAQSTPRPSPVLPLRVRASPFPLIVPPRVPVTSPVPQLSTLDPTARQKPSIIKTVVGDPVRHWYHLWSQINIDELLPAQQENTVINPTTGNVHKYRPLARGPKNALWTKGLANNIRPFSLSVGVRMPTGTNTIYFYHPSQITSDCKVTYEKLVATLWPQKDEEHRVQVTMGGDKLDYPGATATDTANIYTLKLLINIFISTWYAWFLTLDNKHYYYYTTRSCWEYM